MLLWNIPVFSNAKWSILVQSELKKIDIFNNTKQPYKRIIFLSQKFDKKNQPNICNYGLDSRLNEKNQKRYTSLSILFQVMSTYYTNPLIWRMCSINKETDRQAGLDRQINRELYTETLF